MKKRIVYLLVPAALLVGFGTGRGCGTHPAVHAQPEQTAHAAGQTSLWTCSMHPQIRQTKPGKCPICGMDLIPLAAGTAPQGMNMQAPRLALSPAAAALAEIETFPVERRPAAVDVRLTGKVDYDETRLAYVTARVPGRIDRLYADYVGMPVKPGEHLADFYSPSLVAAQQEMLLALKSGDIPGNADRLEAIRERLRLWGLSADQIADIGHSGKVRDHITFLSPIGGIVVAKIALEGLYAETGTRLFTLADMTQLWVKLDAYETDLVWLRYAQPVTFQAEAYPGQTFNGTVAFISPVIDSATRTVSVRVNVDNPEGKLKPGLFVHARVHAQVTADGTAAGPDLRGKWICPMHPEIVKTAAGTCDRCGMALVRAESLGYAGPAQTGAPLVIPASAPLLTGSRAVVYVAVPKAAGTFEGREVELGPRAGDVYVVRAGLHEGERVVVNGAFKIDSALQIQAQPSMMNPADGAAPSMAARMHMPPAATAVPPAVRKQLDGVLTSVLDIYASMARDDLPTARKATARAVQALDGVGGLPFEGDRRARWTAARAALAGALAALTAAPDLDRFRQTLAPLAAAVSATLAATGPLRATPVYRFHCPMALNNRGADWLQADDQLKNPYFGAAMLKCGERVAVIPGADGGAGHE